MDNELIFEGEYLNDKKWTGNGYDPLNNIVYELNNGNGHIKQFWGNGKLNFEGEYLNGKRNGKGKEYDDIIMYEGEYLNGMKHGREKKIIINVFYSLMVNIYIIIKLKVNII